MKRRRPRPWPWLVLAIVLTASSGWGVIAFGPDRTVRAAAAAAANVAIDGLAERPGPHRMPVVELEVSQEDLDILDADLPWSGAQWRPATLIDHGIRYPTHLRYRGYGSVHHMGGKKSFRLRLKKDNPFAPYRRVNFINPKAFNMVNMHMAFWIAGRMGVPVPYDDFVFMRLNGRDHGVMELMEQVDGDFERNRHLVEEEVPVFKGDYPPTRMRDSMAQRPLWGKAEYWNYVSDADSAEAWRKLHALVAVINDPKMPWAQRRDSLAALIDVDAFLRHAAAIKVIDTQHIDNYHNELLVLSPRSRKFYPVLWDPLLMFPPEGEPFYPVHDALSFWLLHDPEWRWRRDQFVYEAVAELHLDSAFRRHLEEVVDRIRPSVLADRNKFGVTSSSPEDVLRISAGHWAMSVWRLRTEMAAYWDRLIQQFDQPEIKVEHDARSVRITGQAGSQISITITGDSLEWGPSEQAAWQVEVAGSDADWITIFPRSAVPDSGGAFRDDQRYVQGPVDMTMHFSTGRIREVIINSHGGPTTTH